MQRLLEQVHTPGQREQQDWPFTANVDGWDGCTFGPLRRCEGEGRQADTQSLILKDVRSLLEEMLRMQTVWAHNQTGKPL